MLRSSPPLDFSSDPRSRCLTNSLATGFCPPALKSVLVKVSPSIRFICFSFDVSSDNHPPNPPPLQPSLCFLESRDFLGGGDIKQRFSAFLPRLPVTFFKCHVSFSHIHSYFLKDVWCLLALATLSGCVVCVTAAVGTPR